MAASASFSAATAAAAASRAAACKEARCQFSHEPHRKVLLSHPPSPPAPLSSPSPYLRLPFLLCEPLRAGLQTALSLHRTAPHRRGSRPPSVSPCTVAATCALDSEAP